MVSKHCYFLMRIMGHHVICCLVKHDIEASLYHHGGLVSCDPPPLFSCHIFHNPPFWRAQKTVSLPCLPPHPTPPHPPFLLISDKSLTWCERHSWRKTIEDKGQKNEENNEDNRFVEQRSFVRCAVSSTWTNQKMRQTINLSPQFIVQEKWLVEIVVLMD